MSTRLIREDDHGTFVLTGGYAFRPPIESAIKAGERVRAVHIGGTTTARVGNETWCSYSADPQYVKHVYPHGGVPERLRPFLHPLPHWLRGAR